jgi:hypothetical protein
MPGANSSLAAYAIALAYEEEIVTTSPSAVVRDICESFCCSDVCWIDSDLYPFAG